MKDAPRELRELIINDRPDTTDGVQIIKGWADAQRFWRQSETQQPDIILCDINFEKDADSPLNLTNTYKPTGLLYALPFLALAKANTLPIVLKFHTADPTLFSRRHSQEAIGKGTKPPHVMCYLAAELVGLVMAMLEVTPGETPVDLDGAWNWLGNRDKTLETEEGARVAGRKEYRRRLATLCRSAGVPGLIVDPDGYQRIVKWCETIATKPSITEADWGNAPGLVLLRADGTRDCISIRSLFYRDDRFVPARFVIQRGDAKKIPPPDAWLSKNEPRIGEFLYDLGDWPRIYSCAAEAIREFPCGGTRSPLTLADAIPATVPGYKIVRLVALVFQAVRLFHHARECWRASYFDTEWSPRDMTCGARSENNTLRQHLESAHTSLKRKSEYAPMTEADIMNALAAYSWAGLGDHLGDRHHLSNWVHFHIEMLITMGMAQRTSEGYRMLKKAFPADLPPCPPELRPQWIRAPINGLAESLGSTGDGSSELRRIPALALYGGDMSAGTEFNQRLCGGVLPGWLREFGREYAAKELAWPQDCHWPDFLR